jgi:hypothetical protein
MKIHIALVFCALGTSLLHSQAPTQAPDASPDGPFVSNLGGYSAGAAAVDNEVLPGCTPVAGYDCRVQITGEFYLPNPLNGRRPLIIFLHGNHATCGHAYNPMNMGGPDPNGLPGAPRIDPYGPDRAVFTGTGACGSPANPLVAPSYRGYDYLANKLATRGYIVISIDANRGINGIDNMPPGVAGDLGLIRARGVLVLKTLAQLSFWDTNGDVPGSLGDLIQGHLDFSNVGLMGHSRGGEAMRAALSLFNGTTATPGNVTNPWPVRIPNLSLRAIFEIAPTDSPAGYNATGIVWNVVLPMCDGDVTDLSGARPFDRAIMALEATPLQKSTYTVWGTNHNFFNTQWQLTEGTNFAAGVPPYPPICRGAGNTAIYDPSPGSAAQQLTAVSSLLAFFRGNVGAVDVTFNQNFNPPFGIPAQVNGVPYPTRVDRGYSPPGAFAVFDDFTVMGHNSTNPAVPHVTSNVTANYGTVPDHDAVLSNALNVQWMAGNANTYFQTNWTPNGKPGMDIRVYETLDIRVSRQDNAANPAGTTDFSIRLVGANGVLTRPLLLSTYIDPNFAGQAGNQSNLTGPVGSTAELHPILQTVRIPLAAFGNFAFIGPQVQGVRLIFDQTPAGSIFVTNIRLSAQIGGGAAMYPPIPPPPAPVSPPPPGPSSAAPIEHPASIASITLVPSAPELGGASGYRIQVQGTFPAQNAFPQMIIGDGIAPPLGNPQVFTTGFDSITSGGLVFTLTTSQFLGLPSGKRVLVQFGPGVPVEFWNCGTLP